MNGNQMLLLAWWEISGFVGLLILAFVFVPIYYRARVTTVTELLEQRYGIPLADLLAGGPDVEGWLEAAAERHTSGDSLRMATKLLDDFRCSRLGSIALELPPGLPIPSMACEQENG
jgi:hypothetical protein